MTAGRPLIFKSVKDFKDCDDFKKEKEFQEYLVNNANFWTKDFFKIDSFAMIEQYYFGDIKYFGANKPKIDICIEGEGKRIGIEVKNPKQCYSELSRSISQLLAYSVLAEESNVKFDELAIMTSRFDPILIKVIKKYKLPIRIFIVNKSIHCEIL